MSKTSFAEGVTAKDLRIFLQLWSVLLSEANEIKQIFIEDQATLLAEDTKRFSWCHWYELPFEQHVSLFFASLTQDEQIKAILNQLVESPNQVGTVSEMAELITEHFDSLEKPDQEETEEARLLLAAFYGHGLSVLNSFKCVLYHGYFLNELIERVRNNDDKALFDAVRIDATVVGCKPVVERISEATLLKDNRFFAKLKASINGKMGNREQANFQKMRLVLEILHEFGATRLTDKQLHELFVKELNFYSDNSIGGGSAKALRKFADTYMKKNTTT